MNQRDSAGEGPVWNGLPWIGLAAGPLAALGIYFGAPQALAEGSAVLTDPGRKTLAVAGLMAVWWLTEAIPLSATALLPLVLLPLLGVAGMKHAAAPYASEIIFLFMGGFMLGLGMERWGLHRRVALLTLLGVGTGPARMVGGVMLATAVISMWVSNTATTLMMLPIGTSVVAMVERLAGGAGDGRAGWTRKTADNFAVCMYLGIAYAASIGGMGTPVGTPPNGVFIGYVQENMGQRIGFLTWMKFGVPMVLIFLPVCWFMLTQVLHRVRAPRIQGGRELLASEWRGLGRMSRGEWAVLAVFLLAAVFWIGREPLCQWLSLVRPGKDGRPEAVLTDAGIAMTAALLLFLIPTDAPKREFVLDWEQAQKLPWGILLLFGGGLSMAETMSATGVEKYMAGMFEGMKGVPELGLLIVLVGATVLLGELAGNTALATALMPILFAAGPKLGVEPLGLMATAALATSCGFMLPVATPPNAIVFATGRIGMRRMIRAGAAMDAASVVLIVAVMYLFGDWVLAGLSM